MKKFSAIILSAGTWLIASGQATLPPPVKLTKDFLSSENHLLQQAGNIQSAGGSRALGSVPAGSSGSLFSVMRGVSNMIASSQALNTIVFIHRADPAASGGESCEFRYDISMDGGTTWRNNIGPLNPLSTNYGNGPAARYPQVSIYNPPGNTNPHDAYLAYLGAWMNPTTQSWDGITEGAAKLNGYSATRTENNPTMNAEEVLIPTALCKGTPGVFWAVDWAFNGIDFSNILVYKGVWDSAANDVTWAIHAILTPPHDLSFDGSVPATDANIAFDPSGKYGWISWAGDINAGGEQVLEPVFYNSVDSGNTWLGPFSLTLRNFSMLMQEITPVNDTAGCSFDSDLAVDLNGDPHFVTMVCPATKGYAIFPVDNAMNMYDFHIRDCDSTWQALKLDSVATYSGTFGSITEANRPQASSSEDGSRLFFFWLDSDPAQTGSGVDNTLPNLIGKGLDVSNRFMTPAINFTKGDSAWDGEAFFGSVSTTTLRKGDLHIIPTIFTQMDTSATADLDPVYYHYIPGIVFSDTLFSICVSSDVCSGDTILPVITLMGGDSITLSKCPSGPGLTWNDPGAVAHSCAGNITDSIQVNDTVNPAANGIYTITYTAIEPNGKTDTATRKVRVSLTDVVAPAITLVGSDPACLALNGSYTDDGAAATDSCYGDLSANITVTDNIDSSTAGAYYVRYNVTDSSGNAAQTVERAVIVMPSSTAAFNYTVSGLMVSFTDSSTNEPESWFWNFGDGTTSALASPAKTYTLPGTYTVCLTATNCTGTGNMTCKSVMVISSVEERGIRNGIQVFPNPSGGSIRIQLPNLQGGLIQVMNVLGSVLYRENIPAQTGSHNIQLDLSPLPPGVYLLELRSNQGVFNQRLILAREQD